jgi:hypothetical protein
MSIIEIIRIENAAGEQARGIVPAWSAYQFGSIDPSHSDESIRVVRNRSG